MVPASLTMVVAEEGRGKGTKQLRLTEGIAFSDLLFILSRVFSKQVSEGQWYLGITVLLSKPSSTLSVWEDISLLFIGGQTEKALIFFCQLVGFSGS